MTERQQSWNLYPELRRPLSSIEDKLKIIQKNVKLSVEVPDVEDIPVQDTSKYVVAPPAFNSIQRSCRGRPQVQEESLSSNDTTLDLVKRPRELSMSRSPQIIFELSRVDADEGDERKSTVSVRKLTWDFNEMLYKPDEHKDKEATRGDDYKRRAISADCRYNREISGFKTTKERPNTAMAATSKSQRTVPLSLEQAATTYPVRSATPADLVRQPDKNLNSTSPVTFPASEPSDGKEIWDKHFSQSRYFMKSEKRTTKGFGGRKTPITSISFSETDSESPSQNERLSYDEILMMRAPLTASRVTITGGSQLQDSTQQNLECKQEFKPTRQPQRRQQRNTSRKSQVTHGDGSKIYKNLRAEIKRQCTMPSYTVLKGVDEESKTDNNESKCEEDKVTVVERAGMSARRNRTKIKPDYIPPSKRHGMKSAPTIPTGKDAPERLGYLTFTLPAARTTKMRTSPMKRARNSVRSAPAIMQTENSLVRDATSDEMGVSGIKVESPRQLKAIKRLRAAKQVETGGDGGPAHIEKPVTGSSHLRVIEESGYQKLHINLPIVPHQSISGISSGNCDSSEFNCSNSRGSIHSSQTEDYFIPVENPLQGAEGEDTARMKERIHQNLLQTLSDTEQFLKAMDQKRRNRKPRIVYSDDDEEDQQETRVEAPEQPTPILRRESVPEPGRKLSQLDDRAVVVTCNNYQQGDADRFIDIIHNFEQRIQDGSDISSNPTQDEISESEFQLQPNNDNFIEQKEK